MSFGQGILGVRQVGVLGLAAFSYVEERREANTTLERETERQREKWSRYSRVGVLGVDEGRECCLASGEGFFCLSGVSHPTGHHRSYHHVFFFLLLLPLLRAERDICHSKRR